MSDFDRVLTWYRVALDATDDDQQYLLWRNIHQVAQHMLPELLSVATAAQDYANDPTSIEKLHNLRQAIKRAQEDTR